MLFHIRKISRFLLSAVFAMAVGTAHAVTITVNGTDDEDFVLVTADIDMSSLTFTGGATSEVAALTYIGSNWNVTARIKVFASSTTGHGITLWNVEFHHKIPHDLTEGTITHFLGDSGEISAADVNRHSANNPSFSFPSAGKNDPHAKHVHEHSAHLFASNIRTNSGFPPVYFFGSDPQVTLYATHPVPLPASGILVISTILGAIALRRHKPKEA